MKKLTISSLLSALVLFSIGCKKDNDDPSGNNGITGQEIEFTGTAQMTIEYWDYDVQSGQYIFIEEKNDSYEFK
jgi:hypothetical protein